MPRSSRAEELQRRYYEDSASAYDAMHDGEREHERAMWHVSAYLRQLGAETILDVGAGTGRGMRYFRDAHPGIGVYGVEPVQALIRQAVQAHGLPEDALTCAPGESLPFADSSFDAVCEFAVLHHVREPDRVVKEMTRVARRAVFLSDENRFGHGTLAARVTKLGLHKVGLWPLANRVKTGGKGYRESEEDGISYSYSVYDSYAHLAAWADRVIFIPTADRPRPGWLSPLLTSSQVLVCAIRE
jgi:ubiquinone/menaquinone biosynthesis C-methylase UbiE